MPINRKVFLSILALDSYQRGYAPGIKGLPQFAAGVTVKIGNATLATDSEAKLGPSAQSTGFYASAYTWGSETIISYRGTDFDDNYGDSCNIPLLGIALEIREIRGRFAAVILTI